MILILTDTCSSPAPEPVGWWRGGVRVAYNQSQCVSDDNRPAGITYASYLSDPESGNPPLPHTVSEGIPHIKSFPCIFPRYIAFAIKYLGDHTVTHGAHQMTCDSIQTLHAIYFW